MNLHRTESTFCISPAQKYLSLCWFKNLTRGCNIEEEMSSLSSAPSCHWLELCMNIVSPLGGIEVECWWLTAGCGLQFLKGSFLRMSFSLKFFIPLPMTITHYIILQNSSSLRNDHLKNCKPQSTVGVTWLPQRHLSVRLWNIHITHNSFQWHDGTDDKDDFSSSILHPRVRFLIQQRDKYFCPRHDGC